MCRVLIVCFVASTLSTTATAATIPVYADGTGTFATIQDAVNAASPGDEIVLAPGTYTGTGNIDVSVSTPDLTIRGDQGSALTTIVGSPSANAFFVSVSSGDFALTGLTIENAARALVCSYADLTVTDVTVLRAAEWGLVVQFAPDASLINVTVRESTRGIQFGACDNMLLDDCATVDNDYFGLYMTISGIATIDDFYCHGNGGLAPSASGIGIRDIDSVDISGSTICHNYGGGFDSEVPCSMTQCTIAFNGDGAAVALLGGGSIDRTIISSTQFGPALDAAGVAISDCNIWDNSGGNGLGGGIDGGGNVSADPMFCGTDGNDNYLLASSSPCAPDNSLSGLLVGAWPVGCGPVSTEATRWGELKAKYR